MDKKTKTIALCGKGGVGKTSISALIIKNLAQRKDLRILAIDADPAVGLCTALGMQVKKTVDDIRNDLIKSIQKGQSQDKAATLNMLDYELFDALTESDNVCLLAIGRPESECSRIVRAKGTSPRKGTPSTSASWRAPPWRAGAGRSRRRASARGR